MNFDVIIVGGGMVGATQAAATAKLGLRTALLEKALPLRSHSPQPDLRTSAFNLASIQYLGRLGIWEKLNTERLREYHRLSVWEQGGRQLTFDSELTGHSCLGAFAENKNLQIAAIETCQTLGVTLFEDTIQQLHSDKQTTLITTSGKELTASLIIGADGAQSKVRQFAGIGTTGWDYAQHCLLATIKCDHPVPAETWQEFQPTGPKALLPLYDEYACLIWYDTPQRIQSLLSYSQETFLKEAYDIFPDRLPKAEIIESGSFPLARQHANAYFKKNTVLIGDAAHTIHPMAGQGVNLGLKDVEILTHTLEQHFVPGESDLFWLKEYERERRYHNLAMMSLMDTCYVANQLNFPGLKRLRQTFFGAIEPFSPLKEKLLRYAIGV